MPLTNKGLNLNKTNEQPSKFRNHKHNDSFKIIKGKNEATASKSDEKKDDLFSAMGMDMSVSNYKKPKIVKITSNVNNSYESKNKLLIHVRLINN